MGSQQTQVFITHSWHDIEFARRLHADLVAHGYPVWLDDKTMQGGHRMAEEINRGLEQCDAYLPIISPQALESPWCWEELNAAIVLSNEKRRQGRPRIIPILAAACELPAVLRGRLYINLADDYEAGISRVFSAIDACGNQGEASGQSKEPSEAALSREWDSTPPQVAEPKLPPALWKQLRKPAVVSNSFFLILVLVLIALQGRIEWWAVFLFGAAISLAMGAYATILFQSNGMAFQLVRAILIGFASGSLPIFAFLVLVVSLLEFFSPDPYKFTNYLLLLINVIVLALFAGLLGSLGGVIGGLLYSRLFSGHLIKKVK